MFVRAEWNAAVVVPFIFRIALDIVFDKGECWHRTPKQSKHENEGKENAVMDGAPALIAIVKAVKRQEHLKVLILYTMFSLFECIYNV